MIPRKYSDILVGQFNKTINHLKESGYSNTMDLSDVEFSCINGKYRSNIRRVKLPDKPVFGPDYCPKLKIN
jgi:hypothetical protein